MIPRVPINALLAAIDTRLQADVLTARFYAFPPAQQARPFGEVVAVTVDPDAFKDAFACRATVSFAVHGQHPTAKDADEIADAAIRSLQRAAFDLSASQWQDKNAGMFDGVLRAQREVDDVGQITWQVNFDVAWLLKSTAG